MKKFTLYTIFLFGLTLITVPQISAATFAEASVGSHSAVLKYDLSAMSEKEKEWFIAFLKGNFFVDGWEEISSDILSSIQPHEREVHETLLNELGFKIGTEWSKPNTVRKIDNDNLRKWGKQLKCTAEETPDLLTEVLQRIDTEVNALIN